MSFSPELTFLPKNKNREFASWEEAEKVMIKLNKLFLKNKIVTFYPKVEPFHNVHGDNTTYIIEVVPFYSLNDIWLKERKYFIKQFNIVFNTCKKMGLVPIDKTNNREWPNGGCHIHIGANLFPTTLDYFKNMENFTKNLYMWYANNPWIKWLFTQYFDDNNSEVLVTLDDLKDKERGLIEAKKFCEKMKWGDPDINTYYSPETVMRLGIEKIGIKMRFPIHGKNSYNTYEFRFFGMVKNAEELYLITNFLNKNIENLVDITNKNQYITTPFLLKSASFNDLYKDLKYMKKSLVVYFKSFDLNFKDYEVFWERNYINRIKYGKLI